MQLNAAMRHAQATGWFDGVHPRVVTAAAARGLAAPNARGWVITEKGRQWGKNTT
jgi:hypothetical protein